MGTRKDRHIITKNQNDWIDVFNESPTFWGMTIFKLSLCHDPLLFFGVTRKSQCMTFLSLISFFFHFSYTRSTRTLNEKNTKITHTKKDYCDSGISARTLNMIISWKSMKYETFIMMKHVWQRFNIIIWD